MYFLRIINSVLHEEDIVTSAQQTQPPISEQSVFTEISRELKTYSDFQAKTQALIFVKIESVSHGGKPFFIQPTID